jgi:hypothetical protein
VYDAQDAAWLQAARQEALGAADAAARHPLAAAARVAARVRPARLEMNPRMQIQTAAQSDMNVASAELRDAACRGYVEFVRAQLADWRADPAAGHSAALRGAALRGYEGAVRALLADGRADPTACDSIALREAKDTAVVELLLADGRADPAARNSAALWYATRYGCLGKVRALLADGRADPAAKDSKALRCAAYLGDVNAVRVLLADGRADPSTILGASSVVSPAVQSALRRAVRWRRRRPWLRACVWPSSAVAHCAL